LLAHAASPIRSACPYDCPDTCGLLVDVSDGRVTGVRGDPEHPYSRGSLCPKVKDYERTVHHAGRLTTPLLRIGPKGEGRFAPTTWDDAIARIATRFREVVAAHGGEAVLPYSYAGTMGLVQRNAHMAFFHKLGASRLDYTICSSAAGAGWRMVMGATPGPDPEEARQSDLVILWGANIVATSIHFAARVKDAKARGARVILIDTWRTPSAALADEVLLVRPGGDGALALGLLHVLERDGLVDREFVAAHVQGWEQLSSEVLPSGAPSRASEVCGLSIESIERLAHTYAAARAPFIKLGYGLTRYGNGAGSARAIACLPAAVGAYAKPGGGLLVATGSASAVNLAPFTREDLQPGPTRLVNMNRLGHALTELDSPRVMALYVHSANPAAVTPDQNAVLRGLAREDLFTVVHERFMTDTARYADVVLPAPTMLETSDLYRGYGHFVMQRTRPAIAPVGESRSNWDVFRALAARMGFAESVFSQTADEVVDALLDAPSPWRDTGDRAALDQGLGVSLHPPRGKWLTASGKIELWNPALPEPLPTWQPSHEDDGALPLRLQTPPAVETLNSSFYEREELVRRQGTPSLRLSPLDAASRGLADGDAVIAWNTLGEVRFRLRVTDTVPAGVAVAVGVPWLTQQPGGRNVNALVSQRLTDAGAGSTFYDNRIDVRSAEAAAPSTQLLT
jgi:anaerobic selenocysteine-containing dehydrogenase